MEHTEAISVNEMSAGAEQDVAEFCMQVVRSWSSWQVSKGRIGDHSLTSAQVDDIYADLKQKFSDHMVKSGSSPQMPDTMAYTYLTFIAGPEHTEASERLGLLRQA